MRKFRYCTCYRQLSRFVKAAVLHLILGELHDWKGEQKKCLE